MVNSEIDKSVAVSFSGYRPEKMLNTANGGETSEQEIKDKLRTIVTQLYDKGFRIFLSGMARGFDLIAAEVIISLKKEFPELKLAAVFPYTETVRTPYLRRISESADIVVNICSGYHNRCFFMRNDYLVENSSLLVCYYDGQHGGTHYTVKLARRQGLPIINILESNDPRLF